MKKIMAFSLVLIVCLFCCSCDLNSSPNTNTNTSTQNNSVCNHVWQEATCTSPKTCSKCRVTEGEPLGHNVVDYKCTKCGISTMTKNDVPNIIDITKISSDINMVGGIDVNITIKNKYSKVIKYINLPIQFYNAVGDVLKNEIGFDDFATLLYTGPLNTNQTDEAYWEACFYNTTFSNTLGFKDIEIQYMDGTTITIPQKFANYVVTSWRN